MPHLTIHFSSALANATDIDALCARLRGVIAGLGAYPVGGIRVRAIPVVHQSVGDGDARNGFFDMVFRIAPGRSDAVKQETGVALMAAVENALASQLAEPHLAISLEIVEIDSRFSWKTNSMHARLEAAR